MHRGNHPRCTAIRTKKGSTFPIHKEKRQRAEEITDGMERDSLKEDVTKSQGKDGPDPVS